MKTLKKAMLIMLAMMMLMSTAVFAADSPVKTSFNANLKKTSVRRERGTAVCTGHLENQ